MPQADPNLQVTGLDFQDYRDDLIRFLRTQARYRDYDFEGSNIRELLDLLAVNGWMQGFFVNMLFAEGFLDSAQLFGSVVSRAKDLNYLPRSAASARATVNVSFTSSNAVVVFQKGQTFSSAVDGRTLTFSVPETVSLVGVDGSFARQIDLLEGPYFSDSYAFNSQDETQKLLLTNDMADISSLVVAVYEDGSTVAQTYARADSMLGLDDTSKSFFLQMEPSGQYRILFGDGVVGKRPKDGSLVVLDYRVTVGAMGNGAKKFSCDFTVPGSSGVTTATVAQSSGGSDREGIESIRLYAPRHYQTQEVATSDGSYETILKEQFPEIRNVSVYGGEEVDPPQFSKVFVAVDIQGTDKIPDSRKDAYSAFLRPRCPKTITPVFVSPDYSYARVSTTVTYDQGTGDLTPDLAESVVHQAVMDWGDANLGKFAATLRYSRLVRAIDDADRGVAGNDTDVLFYKKLRPSTGASQSLQVDFGVPLYSAYPKSGTSFPDSEEFTVRSGTYTLNGETVSLRDDGRGTINVVKKVGVDDQLVTRAGSVDYASGVVSLESWRVDDFPGRFLKLFARPAGKDLSVGRNTILSFEPDEVSVRVVLK